MWRWIRAVVCVWCAFLGDAASAAAVNTMRGDQRNVDSATIATTITITITIVATTALDSVATDTAAAAAAAAAAHGAVHTTGTTHIKV